MTAPPSGPRLAVVYVQYDRAKYARALPRLLSAIDALPAGEATVVVVDNAAEGDWCHAVSDTLFHLGGDNRAWEFSAFDRGLDWLRREGREADVYALATDALLAYGEDYLGLIDREVADERLLTAACLGWMDSFCAPCRILDHEYEVWMRTSLLFLPAAVVERVRPLAWPLDDDAIFGASWRQPFRDDAPLSPELRRLLLDWLTIPAGEERGEAAGWHSRFALSAETFDFFRSKVKSILREHLLSARLRRLGAPCFDFRGVRFPAETLILFPWGMSGRDPTATEDHNTFDPERRGLRHTHFAFGMGSHICLGQFIGMAQIEEGFHVIARRLKNPRLVGKVGWRPYPGVWGVAGLPIAFDT